MNPSQMTSLLNSRNDDSFDLLNHQQQQSQDRAGSTGDGKEQLKEEIFPITPSDLQSNRPIGTSHSFNLDRRSDVGGTRVSNSVDSNTNSSSVREMDHNHNKPSIMFEIDQTLKKYADNLLHTLEGVSSQLSKLEIRTCDIESSVEDLRASVGSNIGNRKLRQLENILREVQEGVQVLRDKQEIVETIQVANLQVLGGDDQGSTARDKVSAPIQTHQSLVPQHLQQLHAIPPNASQPSVQQNPHLVQLPTLLPQSQIPSIPQTEPNFPPPGQQYQYPPQYSQPSHQHPSLARPPLKHHPEENPYMPPQSYPPRIRQLPSTTQSLLPFRPPLKHHHEENHYMPTQRYPPPHSQQLYGAPSDMHEPLPSRHSSEVSSGYGYSGSHPQYSFPYLPTTQILPRALPTASSNDGESRGSSSETGKEVSIDEVVDKVVLMGFSRDQVKATVRRLTEMGQSVDLNVVLDKLMNE